MIDYKAKHYCDSLAANYRNSGSDFVWIMHVTTDYDVL